MARVEELMHGLGLIPGHPVEKLPSGPEYAKHYGVARMTVQQVIRLQRDGGLIVSRQGSGVYVRERTERPVGLRPHPATEPQ